MDFFLLIYHFNPSFSFLSYQTYQTSVSLVLNVKVIGSNPEISISCGIIKFINGFHKSQVN